MAAAAPAVELPVPRESVAAKILRVVAKAPVHAVLVVLGLLLFFHRDWWLHVALNRALEYVGLTSP